MLEMLKSKLYRARITDSCLDYEGSLSIGPAMREAADMLVGEKILVVNVNNGQRFETYVMDGKPGEICLNGAAARLGEVGDVLIVMAFCQLEADKARAHKAKRVVIGEKNAIIRVD